MDKIEIKNITKIFEDKNGGVTALKDLSINIKDGEFISIVGASGCGKTTLLNLIAGFEKPDKGQIFLDNQIIDSVNPDCGMIFQQYALFPWKTVWQNIDFGLKMKRLSKSERNEVVSQYINLIGLTGFEKHYPHQLSGGMKQRVSIARSLITNPKVMLLDEPFAALDAMTRQILQEQLLQIYEKYRKTILFITHSIDEALLLASRIIVMTARPGKIAKEIINDLPYPRNIDVQLSRDYMKLKRIIWSIVQDEVMKSMEIKIEQGNKK